MTTYDSSMHEAFGLDEQNDPETRSIVSGAIDKVFPSGEIDFISALEIDFPDTIDGKVAEAITQEMMNKRDIGSIECISFRAGLLAAVIAIEATDAIKEKHQRSLLDSMIIDGVME